MPARMSGRLAAVCAAAVGSIYAAGYLVTSNSVHPLNPAGSSNTSVQKSSSSPSSSSTPASTNTAQSTNATQSSGTTSQTSTTPKYRDGVYHGSGTNPYGTVAVTLTIHHGRIASVKITDCTTHYPQSVIDPILPNMVMARQSWRVDIISGATASTYDFAEAVYRALQSAQAS